MKKLLLIVLLLLTAAAPAPAQNCRLHRCNCSFISRQKVILHQLQDDLIFWQAQLQQDRTIWSPRIRYMRIKRDMNNIRSLQNAITEQREYVRNLRHSER